MPRPLAFVNKCLSTAD